MLNDVMRTSLYIPGNNPRFIAKAPTSGADIVTFDIEDAVPPQEKANARKMTAESLKMAAEGGSEVYVRINGWHTEWTNDDLEAVVRPGLNGHHPAQDPQCRRREVAGLEDQRDGVPLRHARGQREDERAAGDRLRHHERL